MIVSAWKWLWNVFPDGTPDFLRFVIVFLIFTWLIRRLRGGLGSVLLYPFQLVGRHWLKIWLMIRAPFGKAKWAGWFDLWREGMFKGGGLFLGQWRKWIFWRQDLNHHGEGHFITIAAPGGGKSSASIVPSLLECREGSFIVTDPKGELTAITRRHRESLGRVVYLNPFYKDFEQNTGLEYPDSGFNPFDSIEDGENVRSQADNFARLLSVTDRQESGSYFQDEGAEILGLFITWMVRHELPENRNLTYLYDLVRRQPQEIFEYMDYVDDPLLQADADRFRDMFRHSSGQWAGAISKAQLATKRYVPTTPLSIHTSKSGFDPRWLKSEDVTVYILLPSEHVQTAAPWLNLVIGLLGEAVGRAGKARPVTFLLDELPALGYLPDLRTQMRQHRSAGLRMWLFSQTTAALADRDMYGKEGLADLFGLCDTKQFFSVREHEVAADISRMCGETTQTNRNLNAQDGTGYSTVGVPLIRAEEILKLGKGQQIIIRRDTPPIKAWLVPYFKRRKWRGMTDDNPYREAKK